jgi:ADP-heptose:LPS heptosyltransferase
MSRFLLIQLKRIGDFVLTAPAVHALKEACPDAEIVVVVPAAVAELAACVPGVSRVVPFQQGRINGETWATALAGEWEAVLDFTGTDRSALLTWFSRGAHRLGYAKFSDTSWRRLAYTHLSKAAVRDLHTVDFHLAMVSELLGCPAVELPGPALEVSPATRATVGEKLARAGVNGPFAILHPGTARAGKFWVDERWAEVAEHLHGTHCLQVVLTGTGQGLEKPHLEALRGHLRTPVVDLTGHCSLVEMAALIEKSRLIIGVDSMAMHLAALLGHPQIALFGPTNPFHWRARHDASRVITPGADDAAKAFSSRDKGGEMGGVPTTRVLRVVDELIG